MMSDSDLRVEAYWRVENFTCCWHENQCCLESPPFVVDSLRKSMWCLKVYPRGYLSCDSDCIGVYLSRLSNAKDGKLGLGTVDFEIAILDNGMTPQRTKHICNYKFDENTESGWPNFVNHKEICENRKSFLPEDVLTIRCRIWKHKKGRFNKINAILRTTIKIKRDSFSWSIENFENSVTLSKTPVPVEVFPELISGEKSASIFLSYTTNSKNSEWLKVTISGQFVDNWSWKCNIRFAQSSEFYLVCDNTVTSKDNVRDWLFRPSLTKKDIVKNNNKLLSNGSLVLECEFCLVSHVPEQSVCYEEESNLMANEVSSQQNGHDVLNVEDSEKRSEELNGNDFNSEHLKITPKFQKISQTVDEKVVRKAINDISFESIPSKVLRSQRSESNSEVQENLITTLQQDMKRIFNDGFQSDLTLHVNGEKFNAHTLILCARSSVFQTKLNEQILDKTLNLDDIDPETVSKMLDYIYTDDPGPLNAEIALKLFYSSLKYKLSGLQKICSKYLQRNIDVNNVCDVLELTELDENETMKSEAVTFIFEHEQDVILSNRWKELMKKNLKLTSETMYALFELKFEKCKQVSNKN